MRSAASPSVLPACPAHCSALVKVGSTTALAGVKCEIVPALPEAPDAGRLAVQVRSTRRAGQLDEGGHALLLCVAWQPARFGWVGAMI